MGKLDRQLWQWSIRRPGTIEWRIMGRCLTETEARQWAVTNGYEIRREAEVDGAVRESNGAMPAVASSKRRRAGSSL
jgi:hypothetical protein